MSSIQRRHNGVWRARYRDDVSREHSRHFKTKREAQRWLDEQTSSLVTGSHIDPRTARITMDAWCDRWIEGYGSRRASTVRQAKTHLALIRAEFGPLPLSTIRPSHVRDWTARLKKQGYADSYVYALHARLAQLFNDAVHDGLLARSPVSQRTSPGAGKQRPYVAIDSQVWQLIEAMPDHMRAAVMLAAFAGLRLSEVCGLRVSDIDFMRGSVHPRLQYPADELKTDCSRTPVPIPQSLARELSAHVAAHSRGDVLLVNEWGDQLAPWTLQRHSRQAMGAVPDLPPGFRFHDLRHYYASMLIAGGADVKAVQARLRHASAKTTLDTYAHLMPDSDATTNAAIDGVFQRLADSSRTTEGVASQSRR